MADFCHKCTFEMFGDELAPFNDFVNPSLADDEMQAVLCEGCGFIQVDNRGRKLHFDEETITMMPDELCPHGTKWDLCTAVATRENPHKLAYVSALNFHGVGEFIAQYPEGDASSDEIKLYIPTCNTWADIERLLTP